MRNSGQIWQVVKFDHNIGIFSVIRGTVGEGTGKAKNGFNKGAKTGVHFGKSFTPLYLRKPVHDPPFCFGSITGLLMPFRNFSKSSGSAYL